MRSGRHAFGVYSRREPANETEWPEEPLTCHVIGMLASTRVPSASVVRKPRARGRMAAAGFERDRC